jgi:hypothetical protein
MRRFAHSSLAPEDRATYVRWMRALLAFYGGVALLVVGIIATGIMSNGSTELATPPAGPETPTHAANVSRPVSGTGTWRQGIEQQVGPGFPLARE